MLSAVNDRKVDNTANVGEFDLVKRYELLAGFLLDDIELGHFRQEFQNKVKQRVDKSKTRCCSLWRTLTL